MRLAILALLGAALAPACAAAASEPPVLPEPPEVALPDEPEPAEPREPPAAGKPSAEPPARPPKEGADDETITVTSDRASSQRAGSDAAGRELTRARFAGNVDARRADVKLTCRELEVTFAAEGGKRRPQSARASGAVEVAMPGRRAVAEEALYDMASEQITLSGKKRPVLYHQNDAVAAESFLIHRLKKLVEARGRVSAEIAPRKEPAPGAKGDPKGLPAGPSAAKKTRIDAAGGGLYADGAHQLFLKDEVVVQQEGFRLACDRLWVFFQPQEGKPPEARPEQAPVPAADPLVGALGAGALKKITAAGRVRIETDTRQVEAELAEYRAEGRSIILAGDPAPVIREGGSLLSAPQIVYYLDEDRVESRGGPFKAVLRTEKPGEKPPPAPAR